MNIRYFTANLKISVIVIHINVLKELIFITPTLLLYNELFWQIDIHESKLLSKLN